MVKKKKKKRRNNFFLRKKKFSLYLEQVDGSCGSIRHQCFSKEFHTRSNPNAFLFYSVLKFGHFSDSNLDNKETIEKTKKNISLLMMSNEIKTNGEEKRRSTFDRNDGVSLGFNFDIYSSAFNCAHSLV